MRASIELMSRQSELEKFREFLSGLLSEQGASAEIVEEFYLIGEEILVNIMTYGHDAGQDHCIQVSLELVGQMVRLSFRDDGKAFNPLEVPEPDLDAPIEDRPIGGLGVYLVKELSESVSYERQGRYNTLTVEKKLRAEEES
jgi:anti-sigma regulatory factor (Ser/Thr protein kinase)